MLSQTKLFRKSYTLQCESQLIARHFQVLIKTHIDKLDKQTTFIVKYPVTKDWNSWKHYRQWCFPTRWNARCAQLTVLPADVDVFSAQRHSTWKWALIEARWGTGMRVRTRKKMMCKKLCCLLPQCSFAIHSCSQFDNEEIFKLKKTRKP